MTPKQADQCIELARPVTLRFASGDIAQMQIVSRDRRHFETACGGKYERADVVLVSTEDSEHALTATLIEAADRISDSLQPLYPPQ